MSPGRLAVTITLTAAVCATSAGAGRGRELTSPPPLVRVDQLGFAPDETKTAYVLGGSSGSVAFDVLDPNGRSVLHGHAGASRGRWNATYGVVRPLDLSPLRAPGTYRVHAEGSTSPSFQVASRAELFLPRVEDAVSFFTAQRDGAQVVAGALQRRPAHLRDRGARVYAWPRFVSAGSDLIVGPSLRPIGGPVDLEGGWMDAGDFLKFTHTTAYAETLLLAAQRSLGAAASASLRAETRFGLAWLRKTWDARRRLLYLQVGIGSGNKAGTFNGDHDVWRLPERDDGLTGAANRYLRDRPVFRANRPGAALPPNLAGRVAAAFALAAQVDATTDPAAARKELDRAAQIFAAAKMTGVKPGDVVTALPHAFYPESSWRDDLELGAAELALAAQALHDGRADTWIAAATRWARGYLSHEAGRDTLNLYDTSALAHADLVRALRARGQHGLTSRLLADLRAQLQGGVARANRDPFRAGVDYAEFDAAAHAFGLVATARLYRGLTGDGRYDSFATAERDWALGGNPWGVSLMVGVGSSFPHCMQHVVANLSGSLDGRPPIVRGAVVNGPNSARLFSGGLGDRFAEMRKCPADGRDAYAAFTGHGSRFVDDVRSWQTVEPALDFDAAAALAFALSR